MKEGITMNGKIYLIEYTLIVFLLVLFNKHHSIYNMFIALVIVLVQFGFDIIRTKKQKTTESPKIIIYV